MYRKKEQEIYNTIYNFYKSYGYDSKMTSKERLDIADTRLNSEEKLKAYSKATGDSVRMALSYAGSTRKDLLEAQINDSIISYYRTLNVPEKDIKSIMDNTRYPINNALNNALNNLGDPGHAALRVVAEFDRQTSIHARSGLISYKDLGYPSDVPCKIVPESGACETCQSYGRGTYTYDEAVAVLDGAHPNCRCQIVPTEQAEMENVMVSVYDATLGKLLDEFEEIKTDIGEEGILGYAWQKILDNTLRNKVDAVSALLQDISVPITNGSDLINEFIDSNYKENQDTQKKIIGLINDQNSGPASEIKMGYYESKDKGCGWIATYNAMVLLGESQKPADIVKYYETTGGIVFDGLIGTNSIAIDRYFKTKGFDTEYTSLPSSMDREIEESGVAILEYTDLPIRMHYVTIHYENGEYAIYNEDNTTGKPLTQASIDEWIKESGYIASILITVNK